VLVIVPGAATASNSAEGESKLERNIERDGQVGEALSDDGWTVIRVWEHEDIAPAADRIEQAVVEQRLALGVPR